MDTLMSFKRGGAKGLYRQMSCRGITVLYRLLTQNIEAPKKRTVKSDKHKKKKWKRIIVSKKNKKAAVPLCGSSTVWSSQLIPIYNTTVHKNKSTNVANNVVNCLYHKLNDTNRPLARALHCGMTTTQNKARYWIFY